MNRRTLLQMGATGTAAAALTGVTRAASGPRTVTIRAPGTSGHDYAPALDKLVTYAKRDLASAGGPGMTFCVVDAEGFAATGTLGWADIDRRTPMGAAHLHQIGSISKSFAALCVYRLADEGKIDLDAPLSRYLPDAPLPVEPILVRQILSHTAGLPRSAPVFPRVPDQRLWTGVTPGALFSYSNTGYALIGMLVAKISGKPYPLALRELVLKPLGITGLREVLQASDRAHYAVGYSPLDISGPNMTHVPLGQTQWTNFDTADANIGATADAMIGYLQFLIAVGRGRGAPLFSDAAAQRFCTVQEPVAAAAFGKGVGYVNGLTVADFDGHTTFQPLGGMTGFSSAVMVDPVAGVGCFLSVNAAILGYGPDNVSKYACRLLRQIREGGPAPSPVESTSPDIIKSAEDYTGAYIGPDGDHFQLVARSGRLFLASDGHEGRMQSLGEHGFLSDHPRFGSHFFDFERSGDAVTAVWFGAVLYGRGAAVPQPPVPTDLAALQGVYVGDHPWSGLWRSVIAQGDRLIIETNSVYHVKNTLQRKGDYWQPVSADNPCERVRFENLVNAMPQRLSFSGRDLRRFSGI